MSTKIIAKCLVLKVFGRANVVYLHALPLWPIVFSLSYGKSF